MSEIGALLTEKMGPLPRWGWVALGGGAGVAYYLYKKKSAPAATPDLASSGSAGGSFWQGGSGGLGTGAGGGDGTGTGDTTPPPVTTPPTTTPPAGAGWPDPSTNTLGISEGQALANSGYTLGQALGPGIFGATGPSGQVGIFDATPGHGSPWGEFISGGGNNTSLLYGGQQYNQTPQGWIAGPSTPAVAAANGITGIPGLYNSESPSGWQSPVVNPPNSSVPGGGIVSGGSGPASGQGTPAAYGGGGYATGVVTNNPQ